MPRASSQKFIEANRKKAQHVKDLIALGKAKKKEIDEAEPDPEEASEDEISDEEIVLKPPPKPKQKKAAPPAPPAEPEELPEGLEPPKLVRQTAVSQPDPIHELNKKMEALMMRLEQKETAEKLKQAKEEVERLNNKKTLAFVLNNQKHF
jgi:hypothetical protein